MKERNGFKRKAAFLMAVAMVCSFPQALNAGAAFSGIGPRRISEKSYTTETETKGIGRIEISFESYARLENDVEFTAKLFKDGEEFAVQSFKAGTEKEENEKELVIFKNLASGNYTLEVNAPGFTAFRQDIEVDQKLYTVKLNADLCNGYTYDVNGNHPGLMVMGDVNDDGKVDENDKKHLIDKLEGTIEASDLSTDLNNDGAIDLTDLTYLSKGYNLNGIGTKAHIEVSVSPDFIEAEIPENTILNEDSATVEQMLNGEGTLNLEPANGGAISVENPVSIGFDFGGNGEEAVEVDGITIDTSVDNPITQATIAVEYIDEDGEEKTVDVPYLEGVNYILNESEVYAEVDASGKLNVHLGGQIAVKKVTLTIMGTKKQSTLAEISKVEFVNGMEERIPEPSMDQPENLAAKAGSEQFTVSWDPCLNVKGYQIKVEQGDKTEIIDTVNNFYTVSSFNNGDVKNYTTYKVSVQSLNGTWSSGFCNTVNVTPKPTKRPDKPDNVKAEGKYMSVNVSWKKMDDTQYYTVYYKKNGSDTYEKIEKITGTSYMIQDLENHANYELYVTGSNELGESPQSLHVAATTSDLDLADMPKYNLINRDKNGRPGSDHITAVTRVGGEMVDSVRDEGQTNTAWGAVDGDKFSYYKKDVNYDGGWNWLGGNGLTYTFDQAYTLNTIGLLTVNTDISFMHVKWWDEEGKVHEDWNGAWDYTNFANYRTDEKGKGYYLIQLPKAITATKIQIGTGRWSSPNTVAETYFYKYDTLMDEVMDLYVDNLHTVLKDGVTQATIDDLREKIEAPDEFGETNPNKAAELRELETAERILNAKQISSAVEIYTSLTTSDTGRGFSGLNAWQPLGVSIGMGEEVTIYVGSDGKKTGDSTNLRLICTQYHSESGGVTLDGANLKVGANTFTLSKSLNLANQENGGALYIQYQGNPTTERYSVRVTGGSEIPRLDLYKVTDENVRKERAVAFIKELDEYVPQLEELHNQLHKGSSNNQLKRLEYDQQNCILGASDIMLDTMMISLPAKQILAGAGNGTVEERAEKLLNSMTAMEDMMYLFYQHKGLNASASTALNQIPKQHLNIRYQRMFSGAFMYASGNHIGIEWGSVSGLVNGVPIKSDENGKYISGNYFGWGIAHEIGHNINQGAYSVAEITNNYFAQLAQAKDTNAGMRFQYQNIYNKVSSGTKGNCSNIATQLGMYWQLHLAYDKGMNYKTYANYNEQLANLFYARVDTYARNTSAAPAPGGVALTLGNTDQSLMRLACAAAEKNVLEFFERWGKTPDAATIKYAEQFEKETRAIFYANDDSRVYALNGEGSVLATDGTTQAIGSVSVKIGSAANKVDLSFVSKNITEDDILGYEITRCIYNGSDLEEQPVGFSTTSTFTDTVSTINNRAVFYKVTLVDQYLNRSASFTTDMVKIEHDGSMDKTNWSITASNLTANAVRHTGDEEMPCEQTDDPTALAIDNDLETAYTAKIANNSAELFINLNQTVTVTGLKYTASEEMTASAYEVYVMTEGAWKLVSTGDFKDSETVYFANDDKEYISTYSTDTVKLVLKDQANKYLSIAELDVLAPTGDNVDFRRTEGEQAAVMGILGADYKYGEKADDVIPKDSIVFTGSYKGNPAYNVVMLFDKKGNVVGGFGEEVEVNGEMVAPLLAHQIILADVPEKGNIANVSNGTWIYWIEPDDIDANNLPEEVRVELYRVNNALTNEGERLVSDSLFETVPKNLPEINFSK